MQLYIDDLCDGDLKWYPHSYIMGLLDEKDPDKWEIDVYSLIAHRLNTVQMMNGKQDHVFEKTEGRKKKSDVGGRRPSQGLLNRTLERFTILQLKEVNDAMKIDPPDMPYAVDPMGPAHSRSRLCFAQIVPCGPEGKRQVVLNDTQINDPLFVVELMLGRAILRVYPDSRDPFPSFPNQMVDAINTMYRLTNKGRIQRLIATESVARLMFDESNDHLSGLHCGMDVFSPAQFAFDQEGARWFILTLVGTRMLMFLDMNFIGVYADDDRDELKKWKKAVGNKGGELWTYALELSSLYGAVVPWDARSVLFRTKKEFVRKFHGASMDNFHSASAPMIPVGTNPPIFMIYKTDKLGIVRERTSAVKNVIDGMFDVIPGIGEVETDPRFWEELKKEAAEKDEGKKKDGQSSSSSSSDQ